MPTRTGNVWAAILLIGAILAIRSGEAQAVPPQFECRSDDPTMSNCTALTPTPWQFRANIKFGYALIPAWYDSLSELQAAIENFWSGSWCSMNLTSIDFDRVPGPWITSGTSPKTTFGIPYMHQHRMNYDVQMGTCGTSTTYEPDVLQSRSVECPAGYTRIYEAGPPQVGPYCAVPWYEVDRGRCPTCKNSLVKGNPVDIGGGNKRQREVDYAGAGGSPLSFSRYYDSWSVSETAVGARPPTKLGPAWTADYFQAIRYVP